MGVHTKLKISHILIDISIVIRRTHAAKYIINWFKVVCLTKLLKNSWKFLQELDDDCQTLAIFPTSSRKVPISLGDALPSK